MKTRNNLDFLSIEQKLENYAPLALNSPEFKKSAVIIPIKPTLSSYNVILTARSSSLKYHKGEVSFPGGIFDPKTDKTLQDTALREIFEEIGVPLENVKIIGRLDDLPTLTGFIIRPYIALLTSKKKIEFKINHEEIEELIEVPIEYIAQDNVFYEIPFPKDPKNWKMLCFDYKNPLTNHEFKIWGATAHMLQEFLKKMYDIKVITPEYQRPKLLECVNFLRKQQHE